MADPTAVPRADEHADEVNARISDLVTATSDAAELLADFTDGATLDVTRIALRGTPDHLDAWRDTRTADAELQVLLAGWHEHWRKTARSNRNLAHLAPKGLDLYGWEAPEDCDHETVRLGATHRQIDGAPIVTRVHVDLVRVAQQPTPFRLLGPTTALDIIGPDGIVQEAHPLRCGTRYSGAPNAYHPTRPTWLPPKPEPREPSRYVETNSDRARWMNEARAEGRVEDDGHGGLVIMGRE